MASSRRCGLTYAPISVNSYIRKEQYADVTEIFKELPEHKKRRHVYSLHLLIGAFLGLQAPEIT